MNEELLQALTEEISSALVGGVFGQVFQLGPTELAVDFRPGDGRYLFVSVAPSAPRLYLIRRTVRELERQAIAPSPFVLSLRKRLAGAALQAVVKDEDDRIVRFRFEVRTEAEGVRERVLVAQLTGRSSNLFLLDGEEMILDSLRASPVEGQRPGEVYKPPIAVSLKRSPSPFERGEHPSLSDAADAYYRKLEAERRFDERVAKELARLRREIEKRRKLLVKLEEDRAAHGDAEEHKKIGELLLANLATAERDGRIARIRDFYAEGAPMIEVEVGEGRTLQEEAAHRFARYARAKRAAAEIAARLGSVEEELRKLESRLAELERIKEARDEGALARILPEKGREGLSRSRVAKERLPAGIRRYRSSDGYEILVGRSASENDLLTFRLGRPHDLWLHAADYPGAHVLVRNPTRGEIPHRTLVEAAQLAAAFSQARNDRKVAVNYVWRKFVAKPRNAPPGTVTLAGPRTILVEPRSDLERMAED